MASLNFSSQPHPYKGIKYWIEGETNPDGSGGEYRFFVQLPKSKKPVASKDTFKQVPLANIAACQAIARYVEAIANKLPAPTDW